jgi:hypothetical protein
MAPQFDIGVWYRYPRLAGAAPSLHEWRLVADL